MTKTIYIDGLAVEVTRKRIKRMNLRIHEPDGRVTLSVPYIVSDREIIAFVRSKREWIDKGIRKVRTRTLAHPQPETREEKEAFMDRLSKLERFESDVDTLKDIFLGIYANPVSNKLKL